MKKIIAVLSAIAVLGASTAATAQSFSFSIQSQDRYERDYRYRDHRQPDRFDRYVYEREARRWYQMPPSYYPGRCERRDVVVRDPYTGRRVCVDRHEYRVFLRNQPRYR